MKKILSIIALISCSFLSQAQDHDECLTYITRGYFDGFKQVIQSGSSSFKDSLIREREVINDLLTFLGEANIESCLSKNSADLKNYITKLQSITSYLIKR